MTDRETTAKVKELNQIDFKKRNGLFYSVPLNRNLYFSSKNGSSRNNIMQICDRNSEYKEIF